MTHPSPKADDPEDDRLLRMAQAGNPEARDALCQRLRPALLCYADTLPNPGADADGEDLVQEALQRLILDMGIIRNANHLRRRAYQIVKHLALDRLRIFNNHRTDPLPESFEPLDAPPEPDTSSPSLELQMSLTYLAAELKPLTRPLGELRHRIACWMLDEFVVAGEFPSVRVLAARWGVGHGTAADYRGQILDRWLRALGLYGLLPARNGKQRPRRSCNQLHPEASCGGEPGESPTAIA